jgi:ATP-dependent RNA helicase DeaD
LAQIPQNEGYKINQVSKMTFSDLGINENIIRALQDNKISKPTDIQKKAIPHILQKNQDLIAVAQTGTGKTAAFCLPILQSIDPKSPKIQALVLVPTRELGQQVAREFFIFSKYLPRVFAESVYGGAPIDEQIEHLKRATHVVVATPGRLIDLLDRKALSLEDLKFLVLDEADEMLNMGFKAEIDEILKSCKEGITKLLFTATMPKDVRQLIKEYLADDSAEIRINAEELINQKIEHQYLIYRKSMKLDYLKAFLNERTEQRGILFCRTKVAAKRLSKQLAGFVVSADAIHGNLNQESREKVMRGFKNNRISLLIATDIAARGIDVKDLDYIIHYHLPENSGQYTHRSGRTARAGKSGISISLLKNEEMAEIKLLESQLNIKFSALEVVVPPEAEPGAPVTIYMNMGYDQTFDKESLRTFLVEEAGLDMVDVRNVVVEQSRSYFNIPPKYQQQIFLNLRGMKLAHRNLKLTLDEENSKRNIY